MTFLRSSTSGPLIKPSSSEWDAQIVCACKSNGTLRMAVDYRLLNNKLITTETLHPLPLMDDLLDRLAKAKYLAVLDAKSGYYQMPLKDGDSEKQHLLSLAVISNLLTGHHLVSREQDTACSG